MKAEILPTHTHSEVCTYNILAYIAFLTSMSELLNLVKHMQAYPSDTLEAALRNVFDFDIYRPETISKLHDILDHHGFVVPYPDAIRVANSSV